MAGWSVIQFGLGPFDWLWWRVVGPIVLMSLVCGLILAVPLLYESAMVRQAREFAAELGKVELDRSSLGRGGQLVIRPADSRLERVELSQFGRTQRWRMLVDCVEDGDYALEMWRKERAGGGRVFAPGEGMIGVEDVDQMFWTETTVPKQVASLLRDSEAHRLFAVAAQRGLRFLRVGGNRIAFEFDRGRDNARAMFGLAVLFAHRIREVG